ncbi:MAG: class II aldolase/adducin family protein [Spirochaetota bacterium]
MDLIWEARKEIVKYSHKVQEYGFVSATDGNLSIKLDERRVLITPSGIPKGEMTLDAPIIVDMEGNKLEGAGKPSSEGKMHLEVYRLRNDVKAVIHAHPPKCIAFTIAGFPLDTCLLPEVVVTIGAIPTSKYATPTTEEVPASIREYIQKNDAVMLARHGSLTIGKDLNTAFKILEKMEHTATIAMYARMLGGPIPFTDEELKKLYALRKAWGVEKELMPCQYGGTCQFLQNRDGRKQVEGAPSEPDNGMREKVVEVKEPGKTLDVDLEKLVDLIVERVRQELKSR